MKNREHIFHGAVVVMGVAGSGKTTLGKALARQLKAQFIEGDDLHPSANVAKMSAQIPLTDADRWPWLALVGTSLAGTQGKIASCSALKRSYREKIVEAAGRPVSFIFLDGGRETLERRMRARQDHFMPPALLASQLETLEPPDAHEHALRLDIEQSVSALAAQAGSWLLSQDQ
ncbi:gluconokinase [Taklimakanibacter lacteus]|uniref:gluconokinase n=1 Tax=Taklimakanibacter lacteus TaxID=2268456 RepID=UPI0034D4A59D